MDRIIGPNKKGNEKGSGGSFSLESIENKYFIGNGISWNLYKKEIKVTWPILNLKKIISVLLLLRGRFKEITASIDFKKVFS